MGPGADLVHSQPIVHHVYLDYLVYLVEPSPEVKICVSVVRCIPKQVFVFAAALPRTGSPALRISVITRGGQELI